MFHPITHKDGPLKGKPDHRYTVALEYCGQEQPQWVARFDGQWIGASAFRGSATMLAVGHDCERRGALTFTEITA